MAAQRAYATTAACRHKNEGVRLFSGHGDRPF